MTSVEYYYDEEYDDFFPYDYQNIYSYEYNSDGIRTYKGYEADGTFSYHNYILNGSQIISESVLSSDEENSSYLLVYIYDEVGSPIGMKYHTPYYAAGVFDVFFFEKNLQGDIVAVYNSSGTKLVSYTYDAWGNCTATYPQGWSAAEKAMLNPFRYRGYYLDTETGWYYLQSRYYYSYWGRFINADGYINANGDIVGFNMFAYCSNNPVMFTDPTGEAMFLGIAREFIDIFFEGDGEKQYFNNKSKVSKTLKKSKTMKSIINEGIEKYKEEGLEGELILSGEVVFKSNEKDLWLSVRNAKYTLQIRSKIKHTGFWMFKKTKIQYTVTITVTDIYDFTGIESSDGIGSYLNNAGYYLQEFGIGTPFEWEATYTYESKWKEKK